MGRARGVERAVVCASQHRVAEHPPRFVDRCKRLGRTGRTGVGVVRSCEPAESGSDLRSRCVAADTQHLVVGHGCDRTAASPVLTFRPIREAVDRRDIAAASAVSVCRLPRMRLTIFSLYVVPGSKSCASQSRITSRLPAATGIDCRRPSTTNAPKYLARLVGRVGELGRRRSECWPAAPLVETTSPSTAETIGAADDEAGFDQLAHRLGDLRR